MLDPRYKKLADLLVNYCVQVRAGDKVAIRASELSIPVAREVYRYILRAGGHPHFWMHDDKFAQILIDEGTDAQLEYTDPLTKLMIDEFDCLISLRAPENTRELSGVDKAKQGQLYKTYSQNILRPMMKRSAVGEIRWVTTIIPTPAIAQDANMSTEAFTEFYFGACFLNEYEPVLAWNKVHEEQQLLVDYLAGKSSVKVHGPNVDLTLSIEDRTFINSDGQKNMPSGEVFTGPVEDSVNGWIRFSYPVIYQGDEFENVRLIFENGKVVTATADRNEEQLNRILDTDEGARYLGEFAIGTNKGIQQFTKQILFDEKINGTIHVAVGASYPETGGRNESAIHWDMICDMKDGGKIWIDDVLFYDSGEFFL